MKMEDADKKDHRKPPFTEGRDVIRIGSNLTGDE